MSHSHSDHAAAAGHAHFDEIATVYDESLPSHVVEHYLRKRTAFVEALCPPGSDVVDVGCGTGTLAQRLSARGYRVTGVDPSAGMLAVMRGRSPEVVAIEAAGDHLPLRDNSFDLALTVAAMHHIAAPEAVGDTLAEMVRVTRPGGRVLIWDHNPRNPYWTNLMGRVPQDTGDERLIPATEVMNGLTAAGAQVLSNQQLGLVPDFTPRRAIRVAALAERLFERAPYLHQFAAHNVIVARKRDQRASSRATTSPSEAR